MKCRTCGNDLQGNEYNCPFCGSCVDYTQAVEQAKAYILGNWSGIMIAMKSGDGNVYPAIRISVFL